MTARLISFTAGAKRRYGALTDKGVVDLSARYGSIWPSLKEVIEADMLAALGADARRFPTEFGLDEVQLDLPVPAPEKILCVGVNYPDRNEEYKDGQDAPAYPSLFVRFARSFVGHGVPIIRPKVSPQFDYEGEVALVIGKAGRHIAEKDALKHVAALTLANDGSVRDWVRHGKFNVTQGKNFDASGSIGPWLVPFTDPAQVTDVRLITRVNGDIRQDDRTSRMTFAIPRLISYISTFTTLVAGDIILTGTPTGAGARFDPPRWLKAGDEVSVEADGIGMLTNRVQDEA